MSFEKSIYFICPVRKIDEKVRKTLDAYVEEKRAKGYHVHYPHEINQQASGLVICSAHKLGVMHANEGAHMHYDPTSEGSAFDIGMNIMAGKPLFIVNTDDIKPETEYSKLLMRYASNIDFKDSELFEKIMHRKEEIKREEFIEYDFKGKTTDFLIDFGMAFMFKPVILKNKAEVEQTESKSYENVLLDLHDIYAPTFKPEVLRV